MLLFTFKLLKFLWIIRSPIKNLLWRLPRNAITFASAMSSTGERFHRTTFKKLSARGWPGIDCARVKLLIWMMGNLRSFFKRTMLIWTLVFTPLDIFFAETWFSNKLQIGKCNWMINEVHFFKMRFCYWYYEINIKQSHEFRNDYTGQYVSLDSPILAFCRSALIFSDI